MHAGGSGIVLLAAFIMRPQSESQIGAESHNYTVEWHDRVLGTVLARSSGLIWELIGKILARMNALLR
jgi:hypothetical protein